MGKRDVDRRWPPDMRLIRKHHVASLLIRGLKPYEIFHSLSTETRLAIDGTVEENPYYTVNPTTDKPYSWAAIGRDIQDLRNEWRTQSAEAIESHYGHMLETALEVQRVAWERGDLDKVLDASAEIRAIIGKPIKTENYNLNIDPKDLTNEQIDRLLQGESLQSVLHKEEPRD